MAPRTATLSGPGEITHGELCKSERDHFNAANGIIEKHNTPKIIAKRGLWDKSHTLYKGQTEMPPQRHRDVAEGEEEFGESHQFSN